MTLETLDEVIERFKHNMEFTRRNGDLQGYLKFNQIAEWLKDYKRLLEQEPRWIPIVKREPTEEERADHLKYYGEELCFVVESEMPVNGQEVLVSMGDCVSEDIFDEDFYNFENKELEDVDAWMPKPKSYKEAKQETVLDKIRAEIEEERVHDDWDFGQEIYYNNAIDDVLQIIDKYRNEVEKNEN